MQNKHSLKSTHLNFITFDIILRIYIYILILHVFNDAIRYELIMDVQF